MTEPHERLLTGRVPAAAVHVLERTIPPSVIARYERLSDLSGTVSDALDDLGVLGCVPASDLRPTLPDRRMVGTAVTVRNVHQRRQPLVAAREGVSGAGEIEGHNQVQPGDVLVLQGVPGVSNMGGLSATMAKRQGAVGAVVHGGVRDLGTSRALGFPIWSTELSPVTSKWRVQTVEVNGQVVIGSVVVDAGDLVVADETGVCFVPAEAVLTVLEICEKISAGEERWHADIAAGVPIVEIANRRYVYGKKDNS
jgi:regulator of RNase E activity RraA